MIWSGQQDQCLIKFDRWFKQYWRSPKTTPQVFRVFGLAGTGKSTLAMHFASNISGLVCYGAFTGKASIVMQKKGAAGATTLHSLLYIPEVNKKTGEVTFKRNRESRLASAKLLIADECSMVNEEMKKDILSFGVPVLVLGDPGQLSPPSGCGAFTNGEPDVMLTEIHRQALESPIIYLSMKVREREIIPYGTYGECRVVSKPDMSEMIESEQVILGLNQTRVNCTNSYRRAIGRTTTLPEVGERITAMTNDKQNSGILNGEMFTVTASHPVPSGHQYLKLEATSLDRPDLVNLKLKSHLSCFDSEVDAPIDWRKLSGTQNLYYGYAITAHRSQGSQYKDPYILDESVSFREEWNKWLYTAITRATDKFTLCRKPT